MCIVLDKYGIVSTTVRADWRIKWLKLRGGGPTSNSIGKAWRGLPSKRTDGYSYVRTVTGESRDRATNFWGPSDAGRQALGGGRCLFSLGGDRPAHAYRLFLLLIITG